MVLAALNHKVCRRGARGDFFFHYNIILPCRNRNFGDLLTTKKHSAVESHMKRQSETDFAGEKF
ncbi:MAG: hypothetical protein C4532_00885 [Candidatus Abyssobacteria bacterium SURF_17]|uniref:Uncharacterized protein n=1 Tax=Candidatus Abyssobacteria bacterium SURF_17 TaxID=2093361 RepID=A0A419F950_9BACT|nr:MAG: hypothetical protein C4532_00885 [Candidatus Abyssubacteria bacterium SURF_17]